MTEEDVGVTLNVVYHEVEILNTCQKCGQVVTGGEIYVSLKFPDGRGFALGYNPPMTCCDEPVIAIRVFDSEEETTDTLFEIIETLRKEGGFGKLPFLELIEPKECLN